MSSPEELTLVVGRWQRPIVVLLHLVRWLGLAPTSSGEQQRTAVKSLIRTRFVRPLFRSLSEGAPSVAF
jgi:hypothetical protein